MTRTAPADEAIPCDDLDWFEWVADVVPPDETPADLEDEDLEDEDLKDEEP